MPRATATQVLKGWKAAATKTWGRTRDLTLLPAVRALLSETKAMIRGSRGTGSCHGRNEGLTRGTQRAKVHKQL